MGWTNLRDVNFVSLTAAVLCVDCELISANNSPDCLACGSRAVFNLSRVLGGTLRGQQTAHVIADAELDRLVQELLRTVPTSALLPENHFSESPVAMPRRHHVRAMEVPHIVPSGNRPSEMYLDELDLEPGISVIAERAQALTGATGAAIALRQGHEIVCRARTGRTAPDLGVRLTTGGGISAECVRTGEVVLCHDTEDSAHVNISVCQRLGVRSILAAPLRHLRRTLGIFEVLSSTPNAFDGRDVATMQMLSGIMVAAMSRLSSLRDRENRQLA
jgi:putative methionine-R-sulfoxide reductase with GAF domain